MPISPADLDARTPPSDFQSISSIVGPRVLHVNVIALMILVSFIKACCLVSRQVQLIIPNCQNAWFCFNPRSFSEHTFLQYLCNTA